METSEWADKCFTFTEPPLKEILRAKTANESKFSPW